MIEYERKPASADAFFKLFDVASRDAFAFTDGGPLRPLVHLFSADHDMRILKVTDEAGARRAIDDALRNPFIVAASYSCQTPDALVGYYYTRDSPTRVIRIPIIGDGPDRRLGETVRDATGN